MTNVPTLLAAFALILAAGFTVARSFLLEPLLGNYPKAPTWLRNTLIGTAAAMMFVGLRFLMAYMAGSTQTELNPSPYMLLLACAICIYQGAMLFNIVRQRLPEELWIKLHRVNDRLLCKGATPFWTWLSH
jgi:hypothetical protein